MFRDRVPFPTSTAPPGFHSQHADYAILPVNIQNFHGRGFQHVQRLCALLNLHYSSRLI